MKKIYTLIFAIVLFSGTTKAQLTLTQVINEPVIGDIDTRKDFDSTSTLPTSTGTAQIWNFTSLSSTTNAPVMNTYTVPSAVSGASNYPTSTIAQANNGSFFKSTTNKFEMLGTGGSTLTLTFTNTAIVANWPIMYGYSNTDPIAGTVSTPIGNGTFTGTITTTGAGAGTLQLPNTITYTNCLMVKARMEVDATLSLGTATLVLTTYQYYHSSQKFPILTITYTDLQSPAGPNSNAVVDINNNIFAGINELSLDNSYALYPNPASENVIINLKNEASQNVFVSVINNLGQIVKTLELKGTNINYLLNTADLPKGVYSITTSVGNKSTTKKLVIQ